LADYSNVTKQNGETRTVLVYLIQARKSRNDTRKKCETGANQKCSKNKTRKKKKNSKLFNGFKLGMLYNTTVTAYTHKSFLFRVKKKVTLEEINGDMKHTHIMHADRRPPSIHP
jgi:hypothetical protein